MNVTAIATAGHNNPPSPIDFASDTARTLSEWMKDHPVIETEEQARAAKLLCDRAKNSAAEVEAERDRKVRPLNEEVVEINGTYKAIHNTDPKKPGSLDRVHNELKARISAFLRAEEERRQREAEEARRKQEEAERLAREAEEREREALANAAAGELDVDVATVTAEADTKFAGFQQASRFAARAERDTKVKIGGGFGNAMSLRTAETLVLSDWTAALIAIGITEKIETAILSAARDYRKTNGKLPAGVTSVKDRKI